METSKDTTTERIIRRWSVVVAIMVLVAISFHLMMRTAGLHATIGNTSIEWNLVPLFLALILGGLPQVYDLSKKTLRGEVGSDLLAGISIIVSVLLGEYLAGVLVVLMLSGGQALEAYAVRRASSVLEALAKRMPQVAHRTQQGKLEDISLSHVAIGDVLMVLPHESCPVDGTVVDGHGIMDESYLTGEPYRISKAPGSSVLSGAINGETTLSIRADKLPVDSRYMRIMQVMRQSEQNRPRLRRLADGLGSIYTPVAVGVGLLAWWASGSAVRFLAVLVIATPCPLLIAIPVAIIGAISLSARRGIIIKDPAVLEKISTCRTAIFDKTGTLTYGKPTLTDVLPVPTVDESSLLQQVASIERYSKHPLSGAVLQEAQRRGLPLLEVLEVSEKPGAGLRAKVHGNQIEITSRKKLLQSHPDAQSQLPPLSSGLECVALINDQYAGVLRFRDEPRAEGALFVKHLSPKHHFDRVMIVSGDRESEVRYLADKVGITQVYAQQSPEEKLDIVKRETARGPTVYLGDGINDAPALAVATVGLAFGQNSEVTSEAAGAVVLDSSLEKVDELLHIGQRMRRIAMQSAVGGMALSLIGMLIAALGWLTPVAGALGQEAIDVLAVLNALRVAFVPKALTDYGQPSEAEKVITPTEPVA
ncbi:MAG: heavy metal translocating P-type ATPase [Candidatus Obscuribacterales bacterium]|nr:heavy metal translocating P-type ATPase [Candidatus Obscuribacterales bacterium]